MEFTGIQGQTLKWTQSFLQNGTQRVVINGVASKPKAVVLQYDHDKLTLWEDKWGINFHPDKCYHPHLHVQQPTQAPVHVPSQRPPSQHNRHFTNIPCICASFILY